MRPLIGLPASALAAASVIDATNAPSLAVMAETWGIVIVDRVPAGAPGAMGPLSLGYVGEIGKRDGYTFDAHNAIRVDSPFDYQAAWLPTQTNDKRQGVSRRIDLVPSEGFALDVVWVSRFQAIVHARELTAVALDRLRKALIDAYRMRDHFVAAGARTSL